jgi:hypothetical protein
MGKGNRLHFVFDEGADMVADGLVVIAKLERESAVCGV